MPGWGMVTFPTSHSQNVFPVVPAAFLAISSYMQMHEMPIHDSSVLLTGWSDST